MAELLYREKIEVRSLMERICAKVERNMLIQHLANQVESPELKSQFKNGRHITRVRIEYRSLTDIQESKPAKIYEKLE
jgi:hypothetical protein